MAGGQFDDDEEITGINVTPLVDIVLVLLIIFMVTANFIVRETVEVDLPRAANTQDKTVQGPVMVTMDKDAKVFLDGVETAEPELVAKMKAAVAKDKDVRAIISADQALNYGKVMGLIDLVKEAGIGKFDKLPPASGKDQTAARQEPQPRRKLQPDGELPHHPGQQEAEEVRRETELHTIRAPKRKREADRQPPRLRLRGRGQLAEVRELHSPSPLRRGGKGVRGVKLLRCCRMISCAPSNTARVSSPLIPRPLLREGEGEKSVNIRSASRTSPRHRSCGSRSPTRCHTK